jgi:hypothetical protein
MSCKLCLSGNQSTLNSEIAVDAPGRNGLGEPVSRPVVVFSKLVVCFDCGFTEFRLEQSDLRELAVARHFLPPQAGIPSKHK